MSLTVIAGLNHDVSIVTAHSQVGTGAKMSAGTKVTNLWYGRTGTWRVDYNGYFRNNESIPRKIKTKLTYKNDNKITKEKTN